MSPGNKSKIESRKSEVQAAPGTPHHAYRTPQGATPAPKRLERGEVRAIVCEIIQIIAGPRNHDPIFSDQPLRVSRYAMASRIEQRFEVVLGGDRLDGWTTVEDVVDDVCRAISRAARRECEQAEEGGEGLGAGGLGSGELETRNSKPKTRRARGAADPHVLVMIVVLIAALVVPMTAVLMAQGGDATPHTAPRIPQGVMTNDETRNPNQIRNPKLETEHP